MPLLEISAREPLPTLLSGPAHVIDGDTLDLAGVRIRLHGIDAPEGRQTCERDGSTWLCGQEAAKALRSLVDGQAVECADLLERDRWGRTVARCTAAGRDIAAELVEQGLALAFRRYSVAYVEQEDRARSARRGLWAGKFEEPWDWRRR